MKKQLRKTFYACLPVGMAFIIMMLFSIVTANAQIVYTDVIPDSVISCSYSGSCSGDYSLDLNNDSINDFILAVTSRRIGCSCMGIRFANRDSAVINSTSQSWIADTAGGYAPNTLIDSSLGWTNALHLLASKLPYCTQCIEPGTMLVRPPATGNWNNVSGKYIALKIQAGTNFYYGWIKLGVGIVNDSVSIKIMEYAYNSVPNQPIFTGQINIAPLTFLTSTAYCAGGSIAIPFNTYGIFNANNYFIAQLSDSAGSFNNPTILDSIQSTHADTIHTMIPSGMYQSVNYKIRILSTDSAFQGNPSNNFTINRPPVAMLLNLADTICPLSTVLNANNSGPCIGCSYQWQFNGSDIPNATGSSLPIDNSGRYNVIITNLCGVSISNIDTFFVRPLINVTIPDSMIVCLIDLPMQLNVATPAGGTYQGSGITSPDIFNGPNVGNYNIYYILFDSAGCLFTSTTMHMRVNICTGESEISNINSIDIYPNPATNYLTIALGSNNKKVEVAIADITGKVIYTTITTDTQKVEVDIKDFAEGIYVVQIQSADFIGTKKLVVEK